MTDVEAVLAADRDHVWHPWGKQGVAGGPVLTRAAGCRVWDAEGNRYLDLGSQLVFTNAGHQHPRVVSAIVSQAERLATAAPNYPVAARSEAAQLVADRAPDGFDYVFFTTGGTEAVENAIRAARAVTGRRKILSSYRSYHGNTTASITATGDPRRFGNEFGTDHVHFFSPHRYRSAFWATDPEQEATRGLEHLRQIITVEGPASIAAVLLETVIGAGGVIPPPPGYLAGVRAICDEFDILLILDEVMAGFGRTGRWFAFERYDVVPDLFTVAKGINAGAVPLGAVVFGDRIAAHFQQRPFPGGMTYSGHPLACAAAVGAIHAMTEEDLIARADRLGRDVLGPGLQRLGAEFAAIGDVRGVGAFWALEFVTDRATKQPMPAAAMSEFGAALRRLGVLGLVVGNRLHVAPPLPMSDEEADEAIAVLGEALGVLDAAVQ
jgi:taurine--2-oxoglutarate transaminase